MNEHRQFHLFENMDINMWFKHINIKLPEKATNLLFIITYCNIRYYGIKALCFQMMCTDSSFKRGRDNGAHTSVTIYRLSTNHSCPATSLNVVLFFY